MSGTPARRDRTHRRRLVQAAVLATALVLPMLAKLNPAPRVRVTQLQAGTHIYYRPEPGLPLGLAPPVAKIWHDAIHGGFFHHGL